MFTVNTARVEYDSTNLRWSIRLNVAIDDAHKDCYYIKAIYITNQDNYYDDAWDTVYTDGGDYIITYNEVIEESGSHVYNHVCIENDLIFIKVEAELKEDPECVPSVLECEAKKVLILNVFNVKNIYDRYIQHIKEVNVCCDFPKAFIDFYLRYEAFKVAVITGNYASAIKMYRALMGKDNRSNNINSCGCGRVHR